MPYQSTWRIIYGHGFNLYILNSEYEHMYSAAEDYNDIISLYELVEVLNFLLKKFIVLMQPNAFSGKNSITYTLADPITKMTTKTNDSIKTLRLNKMKSWIQV